MDLQFPTILTIESTKPDTAPVDPFDGAVLELAAQAAFLQAFAEGLAEDERPIEEVAEMKGRGEADFGWRAELHL
jgi:hypothetical protein